MTPRLTLAEPGWLRAEFPNDPTLRQALKRAVEGWQYDHVQREWRVPIGQAANAVQALGGKGRVVVDEAVRVWWRSRAARRRLLERIRQQRDTALQVPTRLPLFPYQRVGVEFVCAAGGRALIADPMGLGKSPMAIGYAVLGQRRTLVCCPASLRINWVREIQRFAGVEAAYWTGARGVVGDPGAQFHVANYDIAHRFVSAFNRLGFTLLVLDEAHYLKNPDARRTKAILGGFTPEERAAWPGITTPELVMLTGTPVLSRPAELYTLVRALDPTLFPNWETYADRYGAWPPDNLTGRPSRPQRLDDLHQQLRTVAIRREKSEVLADLPPKLVSEVYVELDAAAQTRYERLLERLVGEWAAAGRASLQAMQVLNAWLLQQKLPRVRELVDELLDAGRSVLVFATRLEPLQQLRDHYGARAAYIDGTMPAAARQVEVDRIQSGAAPVACLSLRAAGVGLTLTRADSVVFLDLDYVPANHAQAEDRAHRIGQASPVNVYYLLCAGTIDEDLRDLIARKLAVVDTIVDGAPVTRRRSASVFPDLVRRLRARFGR